MSQWQNLLNLYSSNWKKSCKLNVLPCQTYSTSRAYPGVPISCPQLLCLVQYIHDSFQWSDKTEGVKLELVIFHRNLSLYNWQYWLVWIFWLFGCMKRGKELLNSILDTSSWVSLNSFCWSDWRGIYLLQHPAGQTGQPDASLNPQERQ